MGDRRTPAVVIGDARTGTAYLCTCLSSHPQIFCPRGEPLGVYGWPYYFPVEPIDVLRCIHGRELYDVCMCKIQYRQMAPEILTYLMGIQAKIIHLTRNNLLSLTISQIICGRIGRGEVEQPVHSFEEPSPIRVNIPPELFMDSLLLTWHHLYFWRKTLRDHALEINYEQMVGGPYMNEVISSQICQYLEVENLPLYACGLKPTNPYPPSELVENWEEIEGAIHRHIDDFNQMLV